MSRVKALARKKMFDYAESKGSLPKMAAGGRVSEDEELGRYSPNVSSGEPNTDEDLEDEHPMEYMASGGIAGVGKNFRGPHSESQENPDMSHREYAGTEDGADLMGHLEHMGDNDLEYDEGYPEDPQPMPRMAAGGRVPMMEKKPMLKKPRSKIGMATTGAFAQALKKQRM